MFRKQILVLLLPMLLARSASGITVTDFGVASGDYFEFHASNAMFREFTNNHLIDDHNGFFLYSVFISGYSPFTITINQVTDTVRFDLAVNAASYKLVDQDEVLIHDSDWDQYLSSLKNVQVSFKNEVSEGKIKGMFEIINTDAEVGYDTNSTQIQYLTSSNYLNTTVYDIVRFERTTGVILERLHYRDVVTYTGNSTLQDIDSYSFFRGDVVPPLTYSQLKIPGFTLVSSLFPIFTFSWLIMISKSRNRSKRLG